MPSLMITEEQELPLTKQPVSMLDSSTQVNEPMPTPLTSRSIDSHQVHSDSSQSSNTKYFEPLPDKPVQLVRPDPMQHLKLEIVEENVRHLHHINTAVAVVAVVGKFHSGKSFLLNQLMKKQEGFGIGPYVRPQTMGIWMWGKVCAPWLIFMCSLWFTHHDHKLHTSMVTSTKNSFYPHMHMHTQCHPKLLAIGPLCHLSVLWNHTAQHILGLRQTLCL